MKTAERNKKFYEGSEIVKKEWIHENIFYFSTEERGYLNSKEYDNKRFKNFFCNDEYWIFVDEVKIEESNNMCQQIYVLIGNDWLPMQPKKKFTEEYYQKNENEQKINFKEVKKTMNTMQVRAEFRDTMTHYSWELQYDENLLDEINEIANNKIYVIYIDLENAEIKYDTYNRISDYKAQPNHIYTNLFLDSLCHSKMDEDMLYEYAFQYLEEICEEIEYRHKIKKGNKYAGLNIIKRKMTIIR